MDNKEIYTALEKDGWTWECESPCEVRHEDGTFLTGEAAKTLVQKYTIKVAKAKQPEYEEEARKKEEAAALKRLKNRRPRYRTKLADGTKPKGKNSWCVHCDGSCEDEICKGPGVCKCDCHTKLRKLHCLCRKGILKCCCGCGCKCHKRDWELYRKTSEQRERFRKKLEAKRGKKRFAEEGVHEWEKKVLEHVMIRPKNVNSQFKQFIWAMNKEKEVTETGAEFIERMMLTPWGRTYIKEHTPTEPFEVTF